MMSLKSIIFPYYTITYVEHYKVGFFLWAEKL